MTTTIDKAGRVVIPAGAQVAWSDSRYGARDGDRGLVRAVPGPELVRRGERLIARLRAAEGERAPVDVARLIEEERDRWPG